MHLKYLSMLESHRSGAVSALRRDGPIMVSNLAARLIAVGMPAHAGGCLCATLCPISVCQACRT